MCAAVTAAPEDNKRVYSLDLKSPLGVEDLACTRFGHAEDVLQLSEVLQLRFLLRGQPILFGQIQQFQSAMLSCGFAQPSVSTLTSRQHELKCHSTRVLPACA